MVATVTRPISQIRKLRYSVLLFNTCQLEIRNAKPASPIWDPTPLPKYHDISVWGS